MPSETIQGAQGGVTARPLGPTFAGPVQQGGGGAGGTSVPGTAGTGQNCAGESLGIPKWLNWPHLGLMPGGANWNDAKGLVPTGWVRIDCDPTSVHQTRCTCSETVQETEVIVFLYQWPEQVPGRRQMRLRSDFHMVGRGACSLPSGWHSKADRREEVEFINSPIQSLHDAYPHTLRSDRTVVQRCFCATSTTSA